MTLYPLPNLFRNKKIRKGSKKHRKKNEKNSYHYSLLSIHFKY